MEFMELKKRSIIFYSKEIVISVCVCVCTEEYVASWTMENILELEEVLAALFAKQWNYQFSKFIGKNRRKKERKANNDGKKELEEK